LKEISCVGACTKLGWVRCFYFHNFFICYSNLKSIKPLNLTLSPKIIRNRDAKIEKSLESGMA
jgi:hypothetical protein